MPDLLVKLYELPSDKSAAVRRAFSAERNLVCNWVAEHFSPAWAAECEGCFASGRPTCFVVAAHDALLGFACYDTTARGMFGPVGVAESARGNGLGRALLLATLHDMAVAGYAYAIVGGAGADSLAFYRRTVNAIEIPDSEPGFYRGMLGEG